MNVYLLKYNKTRNLSLITYVIINRTLNNI